ncbi:MAG: GMC family oxidoreductase [Deltaproteobacteria bacterium]|nr:GMC family oxidoreductase [Deltaproteobacteria bacterium]
MFVDARSVDDGRVFESDVCIVGAGAAGITLALELAKAKVDVTLVESGDFQLEAATQKLYEGRVIDGDYPPIQLSRLRYLGGTTNHWGGACVPLDPFEFEAHSWLPHSGWPIGRADLDPYYERARAVIGLPRPDFRFDPAEEGAAQDPPLLGAENRDYETVIWRRPQPEPTRMGKKYRETIRSHPRIRCVLNANAIELVPGESGRAITALTARTLTGRELRFEARRFAICMGGIENARLLLASDTRIRGGIGNQNDRVGRYFADHGFRMMGKIHVTQQPAPSWFQEERFWLSDPGPNATPDLVGFATRPSFRARRKLLGFSVIGHVDSGEWDDYRSEIGVQELAAASQGSGEAGKRERRVIRLYFVAEKAPNPDSRITLQPERDAVGMRKVALDLNLQERDWESVNENVRLLSTAVARSGVGRIRIVDPEGLPWCEGTGAHQTGTTRMSDDPKQGVTDRNGKVHGVENLYLCGGSLFPTAGWQHPTLTIFALSLRLADHLAGAGGAPAA